MINLFGNNKVVQNEGVKYSVLLEQFINPFMNKLEGYEYVEDIFDFAIIAWNFGNIKTLIPEEEFEKSTHLMQTEVDSILLNKMINHKVSNFKAYDNFKLKSLYNL